MYLGIDLGTTAIKISCFDSTGKMVYSQGKKNTVIVPQEGRAEIDPYNLWDNVVALITVMPNNIRKRIKGISFSSQGEGFLAIDDQKKPLTNIILSYDKRGTKQTAEVKETFGEEGIYNITGQIISSAHTITKLKYLLDNDILRTDKFFKICCVSDYIISCFGLPPSIDYSLAARTMLFDVNSLTWAKKVLNYLHITEENLSTIKPAGTILGSPTVTISTLLGLPNDCKIIQGGHDQCCAKLGCEKKNESIAIYSLGTTETLVCELNSFDSTLREVGLPCYPHVVPGKFITLPGNFTGGILIEWYLTQFEKNAIITYESLIEDMSLSPTDILILPHFTITGSPYNDDSSTGTIMGLSINTNRSEMIRALYEGITYEILLNLELLKEKGFIFSKLFASGGVTKSKTVMQLKADILGIPIEVSQCTELAGKGAAHLAMKAVCANEEKSKKKKLIKHSRSVFFPNNHYNELYKQRFKKYKKMYNAVKTVFST